MRTTVSVAMIYFGPLNCIACSLITKNSECTAEIAILMSAVIDNKLKAFNVLLLFEQG